jgi:hypothetical protein
MDVPGLLQSDPEGGSGSAGALHVSQRLACLLHTHGFDWDPKPDSQVSGIHHTGARRSEPVFGHIGCRADPDRPRKISGIERKFIFIKRYKIRG